MTAERRPEFPSGPLRLQTICRFESCKSRERKRPHLVKSRMNSTQAASTDAVPLEKIRIVGVCGSLNPDSATRKALELALEAARGAGAITQLLDLREFEFPFAESGFEVTQFPDVTRFNDIIRSSDGMLWATPEYHGSFSGVLKNALDLGSFPEYRGKVVALLGVGGGQIGAINALSHLRTVGRQLHAWVLPSQVSIANAYKAFDEEGRLKDDELGKAVAKLGHELTRWAHMHRSANATEWVPDLS
jgi:FMN reductase